MLSLLIDGTDVFTGDTLFKGSVGGVRAPGSTTYADLKGAIMGTLLKLGPATRIHPGHTDPTTVGDELERNKFVRIWRGLDPEGEESCTAMGEPATLRSCSATTTTAATRPGSAGPTDPTTSCPGSKVQSAP